MCVWARRPKAAAPRETSIHSRPRTAPLIENDMALPVPDVGRLE